MVPLENPLNASAERYRIGYLASSRDSTASLANNCRCDNVFVIMQRIIENLNKDWLYIPTDFKAAAKKICAEAKFTKVHLPHTNVELPYHNFSEQEHCFVSWYRKHFVVPKEATGCRVFVDFAGVMIATTVYVNGKPAGVEHRGGYTPFSFDITKLIQPGKSNVLSVRVDSTERKDIPPFGKVVDYLTFGGIYRDVQLRISDPIYIQHIFARPIDCWVERKRLDVTATLVNTGEKTRTISAIAILHDAAGKKIATASTTFTIAPGTTADANFSMTDLAEIVLWDLDRPTLYRISVTLDNGDQVSERIGFRALGFGEDGYFYINGRRMKLRGLNRHQTFPYIGQAAPARLQRKDADILKFDLACNIVRTSHYPQSTHFLDRCDEIGLLVLEEIPGWQHIGDESWKQVSLSNLRAMIERDRNRPSICLWGVRINESLDDHEFYSRTNSLAHELDPTRQTGGIRVNFQSELLEDVFTMNDFGYDLKPANHQRYLNTEFCGHMFPTKTFDQEERVKQHALYHAHVHNQVNAPTHSSSGAIGWCAFDYNTHAVFGSGDRICYHGVMDIFRQPKFAAHFYASQADPTKKIVLELAAYWKMGDKNGGGAEPVLIFSNVDEIEIIVGEKSRGRFHPDRQTFPHLAHPPFICTGIGGIWGGDWQPLALRGYINNQLVATKKISNDGIPKNLEMIADDTTLNADGSDMTRISLRITDDFGNILPFAMDPVTLTLTGPGTLVGDNPFPMPGGRGAVYVRAARRAGTITVTAQTARLQKKKVVIRTKS
jgi:beta-galactosidase